jgi:hypothetical protein
VAGADLVGEKKRSAHKDGDDEAGDEAEGEDCLFHGNQSSLEGKVRSSGGSVAGAAGDVVILLDDFALGGRKIMLLGEGTARE